MVLVKTLNQNDVFVDPQSGEMNGIWDGRMENGEEAPDGTYFYMIEVEHGGQRYFYKNFLELVRAQVQ
jgi:flagellar hook assembly protein FlgD